MEYLTDEQRREAGCIAGRMQQDFWDTTLVPASAAEFGAWARETFALTPAELALLELAESALMLARESEAPMVRLQAAAQCQALIKRI